MIGESFPILYQIIEKCNRKFVFYAHLYFTRGHALDFVCDIPAPNPGTAFLQADLAALAVPLGNLQTVHMDFLALILDHRVFSVQI